jgi:hypothetical protein
MTDRPKTIWTPEAIRALGVRTTVPIAGANAVWHQGRAEAVWPGPDCGLRRFVRAIPPRRPRNARESAGCSVSAYRDSLPPEQKPAYDAAVFAAGRLLAEICEDLRQERATWDQQEDRRSP